MSQRMITFFSDKKQEEFTEEDENNRNIDYKPWNISNLATYNLKSELWTEQKFLDYNCDFF